MRLHTKNDNVIKDIFECSTTVVVDAEVLGSGGVETLSDTRVGSSCGTGRLVHHIHPGTDRCAQKFFGGIPIPTEEDLASAKRDEPGKLTPKNLKGIGGVRQIPLNVCGSVLKARETEGSQHIVCGT